jgi:hypothetical protein
VLSANSRRKIATFGLVAMLSGTAVAIAGAPASAVSYGPPVNNCYGIWWTRDWNQDCNNGGASRAGYYQSIANCTAPEIPDKSMEKYRQRLSTQSYDGSDCQYGIHDVITRYR